MKENDQLAALLPAPSLAYAERINMPYLGYHLLRETLTSTLLGESESPILYWIGKDMGKKIPIRSANGIILPFVRLGLGKLDLLEESSGQICYSLSHTIYKYMTKERLCRTLGFESGVIAGSVERWQGRLVEAQLEVEEQESVRIVVRF
ncbi:DUF2507 domain-containing protein [Brevibacillus sp. TJ4]|uniref:DUF2507 domain-containing protein n=1 Tax=Brevibacillus sp. TJ4 TaxID=3234853 RepID=UPI0037D1AF0D